MPGAVGNFRKLGPVVECEPGQGRYCRSCLHEPQLNGEVFSGADDPRVDARSPACVITNVRGAESSASPAAGAGQLHDDFLLVDKVVPVAA
ncbi:hypothetical protein [Paenarthrobacter histidinolovorans]|uniref:hypothetical protein n=1 Tax=Paenarthrobacter histidinolovorans TaxID=43664 RepID=UPI001667265D|nr:hypothetical protein [Paenarthrobacter histidinolovorans]GGJ40598.1 hypothetical protein GCM10010052_42120 [Paenarthrobacter histidinolovorans]